MIYFTFFFSNEIFNIRYFILNTVSQFRAGIYPMLSGHHTGQHKSRISWCFLKNQGIYLGSGTSLSFHDLSG